MDGDTLGLILSTIKDNREINREDFKDLSTKFTDLHALVIQIDKSIVGQERCNMIMKEYDAMVRASNEILREEIASNHQKLMDEIAPLKIDIECLKDQKIIVDYQKGLVNIGWKAVTGSPALGGIMALLGAIAAGVYWPQLQDAISAYGLQAVLIGIGVVILASVVAWVSRRRVAKAVEGKKIKFWFI